MNSLEMSSVEVMNEENAENLEREYLLSAAEDAYENNIIFIQKKLDNLVTFYYIIIVTEKNTF